MAKEQGLQCAITSLATAIPSPLSMFDGAEARRMQLASQVRRWAFDGVELVQLREKQVQSGELFRLTTTAMETLRERPGARTRLLVNGRPDVAVAAGAHGVHLSARAGELRPEQVRAVFRGAGLMECLVSVSCHDLAEVDAARKDGADLVLFGAVFEKRVGEAVAIEGAGLQKLREACELAGGLRVLALGGVTAETAGLCMAAGAAGVAGIRLFA